jgi:hypothetical protein
MILNVTDILNSIIPVWKIKIYIPVDMFDVELNSITTTFCMILLLILRLWPVHVNDMLIEKLLHWCQKQSRITIRLDCFRDSNICTLFLQTVKVQGLVWHTIREPCPRMLSTKDIEASVLVNRSNIWMKPISSKLFFQLACQSWSKQETRCHCGTSWLSETSDSANWVVFAKLLRIALMEQSQDCAATFHWHPWKQINSKQQ